MFGLTKRHFGFFSSLLKQILGFFCVLGGGWLGLLICFSVFPIFGHYFQTFVCLFSCLFSKKNVDSFGQVVILDGKNAS